MPHLDLPLPLTLSLGLLASCFVVGCHDDSPPVGPNSVVATANPAGETTAHPRAALPSPRISPPCPMTGAAPLRASSAARWERMLSASGTLSLDFSYTNNSGTEKTGSVDIPYVTIGARLYAGQFGELHYCDIDENTGALANCAVSNGGATSGLMVQLAIQ